jgi:hypothetical protein
MAVMDWWVTHGVGPEFKPQYCQKKKNMVGYLLSAFEVYTTRNFRDNLCEVHTCRVLI